MSRIKAGKRRAAKNTRMKSALDEDGLDFPPETTRRQFADAVRKEPAYLGPKLEERNIKLEQEAKASVLPGYSSRRVRSMRSWRSCASTLSVAIGLASRRLSAIGSPVSSQ